ncbi:hypothetical protein MKX01_028308 [Papaver californicum]|nr:hypothetical protein MKX01_028308 [Papaver californicum]
MASGIARRVASGHLLLGLKYQLTIAMNNRNKLLVVFSEIEKAPTCFNAPKLSSEYGIIDKLVVDTTVPFIRKYLNDNMARKFTNHRNNRINWLSILICSNCRNDHGMDLTKVPYNHRGGSLLFVVHRELIFGLNNTHTHMVNNSDDEDEGSQPPKELAIFNEVAGAKRCKRQRPPSASSSDGVVNEFKDQILKYQDEINEMKDENEKMEDDNAAFKKSNRFPSNYVY